MVCLYSFWVFGSCFTGYFPPYYPVHCHRGIWAAWRRIAHQDGPVVGSSASYPPWCSEGCIEYSYHLAPYCITHCQSKLICFWSKPDTSTCWHICWLKSMYSNIYFICFLERKKKHPTNSLIQVLIWKMHCDVELPFLEEGKMTVRIYVSGTCLDGA